MANCRTPGSISTRKHWRGPPRLPRAPGSNAGTPTPHGTIRKVSEYVEQRQRLLNRKQQLPRESMATCAKSVGDIFLSAGVTFSSVCFSCITPHGAVASSRCRPKAVTCIVLKMSVIGYIGNLPTGICVDYFPLETLESNPILEAFTVPVLWVPKAIQTTIPRF